MSSIVRLSIALVLGIAAGVGNYLWMGWQETRHASFIVARAEIQAGKPIEASDLGTIKIPGDLEELRKTFILAGEGNSLLVGTRANRSYKPGDLVLHDHLESRVPHWQALGSFRLLSVGERIRTGDRYSDGRGNNTVTIAAKLDEHGNYDAKTERLLDLVAAQSDRSSKLRIVAIQLDPSPVTDDAMSDSEDVVEGTNEESLEGEPELPLGPRERGIIVPLRGVETIPEVLVRGNYVSFIVDWFGGDAMLDMGEAKTAPNMVGD